MLSRSQGWKWKASEAMRAGGVETQGPAPLIWRTRVTCATPLRLMAYLCGWAQINPNFDVQEAEEGGCGVQETGSSMTVQLCVSGLRENLWAWELSWFIQKYAWRDWSVSLDKGLWIHCRSTENQFTRWYHKEVTYHIMYHFTQSLCTGDLQM